MSSYETAAYHPVEKTIRRAVWIDDFFGRHKYGVRFDDGGRVYTVDQVDIPLDIVFVDKDRDRQSTHDGSQDVTMIERLRKRAAKLSDENAVLRSVIDDVRAALNE